jgi:hypothetical protein
LQQDGESHLVIVRYGAEHSVHDEWVYNDADIDNSKVVWAREMDSERNLELMDYFKNRRVWLLQADAKVPDIVPYTEASVAGHLAVYLNDNGNNLMVSSVSKLTR